MTAGSSPRRFIAGAVCPRCGEMDKIVAFQNAGGRSVRECVACGFNEELREVDAPNEPATRVNRPTFGRTPMARQQVPAKEVESQPLRFLDASPKKGHADAERGTAKSSDGPSED